jgi:outer membrane protein
MKITVENFSLDSVKAIAVRNRSELKSLYLKLSASKSLISAAWDQNLPILSITGSYNWSGFNLPLYSRWNAGINFMLPIFQGFAVNAQVQQAEANVEQAQANLEALKQTILLDVEQNYLTLIEAENRIDAANQLVIQAEENFKLAEGRYKSGVGSATEITDAQVTLANAKTSRIQAMYDYLTALIRLKKSMGIIDINTQ